MLERWRPSGVDEWKKAYGLQLEIWLKAMGEQEKGAAFLDGLPLSAHMRNNWESGRFWLNCAARKSWAFDAFFWNFLDERFFGLRDSGAPDEELWMVRLELLAREKQQAMEPFVRRKLEEFRERALVYWEPAEARCRPSELLFEHFAGGLAPPFQSTAREHLCSTSRYISHLITSAPCSVEIKVGTEPFESIFPLHLSAKKKN